MKKNICIFFLFFLFSCSSNKELRKEREIWNFKNWKQEYKDRAFCLCIQKGFENRKLESELIDNDKSFYNPLGIAIFDKSLIPLINDKVKKIRLDSMNSIDTYPSDLKPIYNKRAVLSNCINFYKSKILDNTAKNEEKKWKKIKGISDEIHKEIPTY